MNTRSDVTFAPGRKALARKLALIGALLVCANVSALASPARYLVYADTPREPKGSITTWSATNSGDTIIFELHNSSSGSNWLVNFRLADGHPSGINPGDDEREPKGSPNTFFDSRDNPNIGCYLHNNVSGSNWVYSRGPSRMITLPYILTDLDAGVTYEVEADGRHVSATDRFGALLWYRDPFADARLEHYRTDKPCIVEFDLHKRGVSDSEDWTFPERTLGMHGVNRYISVSFNSSQFGLMDVTTGDFFFSGQD
jgi:hypothetical protein